MSFRYQIIDEEFDKEYKVWEYKNMKAECNRPGVYVLSDITGDILYIGESENVGGRVCGHISGSPESKRGFQKRICTIKLYLFNNTSQGKADMKMCEHWIKSKLPALYSKDDYNYNSRSTLDYTLDESTLFKNWHKYHDEAFGEVIDGKEYQEKLIAANLKL